jgi:hypothetical protein
MLLPQPPMDVSVRCRVLTLTSHLACSVRASLQVVPGPGIGLEVVDMSIDMCGWPGEAVRSAGYGPDAEAYPLGVECRLLCGEGCDDIDDS